MLKRLKANLTTIVAGIVMIFAALIILSNLESTLVALSLVLGIVFLLIGALLTLSYFKLQDASEVRNSLSLLVGLFLVALGLLFFFQPTLSASIFSYILAFWFIVESIFNLKQLGFLKGVGSIYYATSLALNLLLLAGGVLLLFNPLIVGISLSIILGLSLLLSGIARIFLAFVGTHEIS